MYETNTKYKTSICRHFLEKGYCSMKQKCHFAHGQHQLRTVDDPVPVNISAQLKPVSIFKTQLCKYYEKGYCKNGHDCSFAHGEQDMRSMPVVPSSTSLKQPAHIVPINCPPPVYPMYMVPVPMMMPMVSSSVNPHTANLLTMVRNLYQVFPNNQSVFRQLNAAQQYALNGQHQKSKQIIDNIFNDSQRTPIEKQKQRKIMSSMAYLNSLVPSHYGSNYDV